MENEIIYDYRDQLVRNFLMVIESPFPNMDENGVHWFDPKDQNYYEISKAVNSDTTITSMEKLKQTGYFDNVSIILFFGDNQEITQWREKYKTLYLEKNVLSKLIYISSLWIPAKSLPG